MGIFAYPHCYHSAPVLGVGYLVSKPPVAGSRPLLGSMVSQLAHATAPSAPMDLSPIPQRGSSHEVEESPVTATRTSTSHHERGRGQRMTMKTVQPSQRCGGCTKLVPDADRKKSCCSPWSIDIDKWFLQCDAKFPTCSACEANGIECVQEDKHRQTARPRWYLELVETQIRKCVALLSNFISTFELQRLDDYLSEFGIDHRLYHSPHESIHPPRPSPTLKDTGIGHEEKLGLKYSSQPVPEPSDNGSKNPSPLSEAHHSQDTNVQHLQGPLPKPPPTRDPENDSNVPGSVIPGPLPHDLSDRQGLIASFQVSRKLARSLEPVEPIQDDVLAGLAQDGHDTFREIDQDWIPAPLKRCERSLQKQPFFLPRNRDRVASVLKTYFDDLNPHRPVFIREEFIAMVDSLYDSLEDEKAAAISPNTRHAVPGKSELQTRFAPRVQNLWDWPHPETFYEYAISLKPDLPNSITTLQAFILLHWYLYIEQHGRGLWRVVGNLIRLAVDLGLHRNPNEEKLFSPKECQLQNFNLNIALGHIQAEVVNSLHRPGKLSGEQVVRRAIEVERSLEQWRLKAPRHYQELFVGHSHWGIDQRRKLLTSRVTPECGITLLKYGVLRMSVLRCMFNNNDVSTHLRYKTLHDAVIVAHNVLVIHAQLATYPEATFFVSPMPIYIASMIILLAVLSRVETLAWGLSKEDIQLSLKLYSLFRWRWPRHQDTGLNVLITRIAKKHYGYKFPMETGPCLPPILLDEMYWLTSEALRSKIPPSLENVWDLRVPARAPEPMQTGIGVETHEHRPHLPLAVSLEQQQDCFVAAQSPFTEYVIASMIDIDTSGGAEHGGQPQYNMDIVAELRELCGQPSIPHLQDAQQASSDAGLPSTTDPAAEEDPDPLLGWLSECQAALGTMSGHPLDSNSSERYDVLPPVQVNFGEVAQATQGDQDMMDMQQEGAEDYIYISELDLAGHQSLEPELEYMQPY
ncbi:hypothetical protein BS47DRAFT_1378679 [Hydnum rufescens UP504]|uniref:Transcription factor domain-containing protein n=1 Tax=Hydnum rufescens UP504 TaxID=1448309 RepID=A0A9P6E2A7_9AGAM|nr:hypothetical protein BS47DRAFT_1378679 [Hydnum rufescens UP504]